MKQDQLSYRKYAILAALILVPLGATFYLLSSYEDSKKNEEKSMSEVTAPVDTAQPVVVEELKTISDTITFAFNSESLAPSSQNTLNEIAQSLKENPLTQWQIQGHTDARGSQSYNQSLGERRAQSVVSYLVNAGVSAKQLSIVSFGESSPLEQGSSEQAYAANRRVSFERLKALSAAE